MSLLPGATYSAPGVPLYGSGGGGGGGGGPDPSFSTISMQPNADINWSGSLNFQSDQSTYMTLQSTLSGTEGLGIQLSLQPPGLNGSEFMLGTVSTGAAYISTSQGQLDMTGNKLLGVSTLAVSSINGTAYPPPGSTTPSAITPIQTYTYVPAGGATTSIANLGVLTNGHWYRLEGTLRYNLQPSTVTLAASDSIGLTFLGNLNNFANNNTVLCSQISTAQNDVYQNFSIVAKANNGLAAALAGYGSLGTTYSTSIGVELPLVLTDLGAF